MANNPNEFEIFTPIDSKVIEQWMGKMKHYMYNVVASVIGIEKPSDVLFSRKTFYEIFNRIEKRRVYFHIYHKGMKMGEVYEGALLCFWILKLMPFRTTKDIPNSLFNTRIAFIVFMNMLYYVSNKKNQKIEKEGKTRPRTRVNIRNKQMDDILYAFQYRDLSKEAIMAMADSHLYLDHN
jgi:hypothetical protein